MNYTNIVFVFLQVYKMNYVKRPVCKGLVWGKNKTAERYPVVLQISLWLHYKKSVRKKYIFPCYNSVSAKATSICALNVSKHILKLLKLNKKVRCSFYFLILNAQTLFLPTQSERNHLFPEYFSLTFYSPTVNCAGYVNFKMSNLNIFSTV